MDDDPVRRAHQFLVVSAAGMARVGTLAGVAALRGEGQEWMYVAPFFLIMARCSCSCCFTDLVSDTAHFLHGV